MQLLRDGIFPFKGKWQQGLGLQSWIYLCIKTHGTMSFGQMTVIMQTVENQAHQFHKRIISSLEHGDEGVMDCAGPFLVNELNINFSKTKHFRTYCIRQMGFQQDNDTKHSRGSSTGDQNVMLCRKNFCKPQLNEAMW